MRVDRRTWTSWLNRLTTVAAGAAYSKRLLQRTGTTARGCAGLRRHAKTQSYSEAMRSRHGTARPHVDAWLAHLHRNCRTAQDELPHAGVPSPRHGSNIIPIDQPTETAAMAFAAIIIITTTTTCVKEVMFLPLSVCLSVSRIANKFGRILMDVFGGVWTNNKRRNFYQFGIQGM